VNKILADLLTTGQTTRADGAKVVLHSTTTREEGEALQRLIRAYKPDVTLEVGLAFGISALFICEALAEIGGRAHIAIDPLQRGWDNLGLRHLEQAGFRSFVEHIEAPSHRALPALEAAGRRIDFAFIDGWHTFDYAMVDFFYIDLLLRPGGVLVLDDAWSYPSIRKLARYIVKHRRYKPIATGIVSPAARPWLHSLLTPLHAAPMRRWLAPILQPAVLTPDSVLGLPSHDLVAFEKMGDDSLGDGSQGSRRWDQHVPF
jgi:predicted O-methyltransferase YrrM